MLTWLLFGQVRRIIRVRKETTGEMRWPHLWEGRRALLRSIATGARRLLRPPRWTLLLFATLRQRASSPGWPPASTQSSWATGRLLGTGIMSRRRPIMSPKCLRSTSCVGRCLPMTQTTACRSTSRHWSTGKAIQVSHPYHTMPYPPWQLHNLIFLSLLACIHSVKVWNVSPE